MGHMTDTHTHTHTAVLILTLSPSLSEIVIIAQNISVDISLVKVIIHSTVFTLTQ